MIICLKLPVDMCIVTYVYVRMQSYACTYVRMYIRMYVRMYVCMHLCMHMYMYALPAKFVHK